MITTQDASPSEAPRTHRALWIIGALVAVLIIFMVVHILAGKKPARAAPPQVVKVAKAALGDVPETLSELGTVAPLATVTVLPQLSGYLTEVGYKEGQDVKKGQFLAQIDPRQYEIDLKQAQAALLKDQASLDQARSDLARYHELRTQKAIAEQTVTDQESTVKQDEAQVESDQPTSRNSSSTSSTATSPRRSRAGSGCA
jgi:multidrug efflux system membrane fusion protein